MKDMEIKLIKNPIVSENEDIFEQFKKEVQNALEEVLVEED